MKYYRRTKTCSIAWQKKGLFNFYVDGHHECCGIRKVESLKRKLPHLDAWITGQRKDQSPDTRQSIPEAQMDSEFSSAGQPLIKFNPLVNWSLTQVWDYIEDYQVPYNELHEKGFTSIGCEPCTHAILPHEHERTAADGGKREPKKNAACMPEISKITVLPDTDS